MSFIGHGVSRRDLFRVLAISISSVAVVPRVLRGVAYAQVKVNKTQAQYQESPKGDQKCSGCANFQPPNACKVVEGQISPNGWCALFVPKAG
jgi:hypothetical protein